MIRFRGKKFRVFCTELYNLKMKTKIIATIGPSSEDVTIIKHLVKEGMDIARFNTKYTTHDELHKIINLVKKEHGQVLIDLKQHLDQIVMRQ